MRPATHQLPPFLALLVLTACARAENPPAAPAKPAEDPAAKRDAEILAGAKDPAVLKSGKETYTGLCLACHGAATVKGDSPSNLFDGKWFHGSRPSEIERTIQKGVVEKGMPAWGEVLPSEDTAALVAYILSQQKP
jgi:cytochrome c oxidase cbb3-type subunit 3